MISKWGIETQPCSLPLLPKGPDSSQGAIPVAAYPGQLVAPPWDSTTSLTQSLLIVSVIVSVIGCLTLTSLFAREYKENPTCRTKQHTTYSAGTSRPFPIHPNCIAVWQGPQFPRLSQGLRGFPPPTLSSDCPGWLMGPWVPQYIYVGPLSPTGVSVSFPQPALMSPPAVTGLVQRPRSLCSLHTRAPRHKHLNLHGPSLW